MSSSASLSARDLMAWGSILDHEPTESANRVKNLFLRARSKISGASLYLSAFGQVQFKNSRLTLQLGSDEKRRLESSLQRKSGVSPKIFSSGFKDLSIILKVKGSNSNVASNDSPTKTKSLTPSRSNLSQVGTPTRRTGSTSKSRADKLRSTVEGQSEQGVSRNKRKRDLESLSVSEKINSSSKKLEDEAQDKGGQREDDDDDHLVNLSPSNKRKRVKDRQSFEPSKLLAKRLATDRQMFKVPVLNLPIKNPTQPICIFQSKPILNPTKNCNDKGLLNFCDWNWKRKSGRPIWLQ
ncbi:hypothetical protein BY996DRAFT_6490317 [Phakopsora pachyrhizi]|nr:hypothetical protein BY996DRAFT_6490317 [Phakopsora pachyrhizi]